LNGNALSEEVQSWLAAFKAANGRVARVLHIGNVANNAYNNAKLMRAAGVDCDVLCYNYYHIMGCPEWEDADFEVAPADHFYPDWTTIDLHGFVRPKWFAQGPCGLCIDYLIALRRGDGPRAEVLWKALAHANRTRSRSALNRAAWILQKAWESIADLFRAALLHPEPRAGVRTRLRPLLARSGPVLGSIAVECGYAAVIFLRTMNAIVRSDDSPFNQRARKLVGQYKSEFPDRGDELTLRDLRQYERFHARWQALFAHYDIVQAYATDPILPLMCGKPYFAFEHGTLREIPLEKTPQGRTTLISFRLAQHVFVTNHDCLDIARRLAGERVSFINHPYDEDQGLHVTGWEREREEISRLTDASFLFFLPTRHDWREGRSYAGKANDIFLRAFCELRRSGRRVGLVCCEWGVDVEDSKQLLEEQGCSAFVYWVPPLGIMRFSRMAKACHVVVDQFLIGAFGGVVFKALAVGAPVLTYLDEAAIRGLYAEIPPVLNCRTTEQIVAAAGELIDNPANLRGLSDASRRWMKKYHSAAKTVEAQFLAYSRHVSGNLKTSLSTVRDEVVTMT
jgi:glycosyltransferase involved in cell wall biosynthesis